MGRNAEILAPSVQIEMEGNVMDAVEFIRERNRMCRAFGKSCDGCPAVYANGWGCDDDAWDEKLVDTVEKWSAAHPRKTRQSVFWEQYPEAHIDDNGVIYMCPGDISTVYRDSNGWCRDPSCKCDECRREFWMQEVE